MFNGKGYDKYILSIYAFVVREVIILIVLHA